MVILILKVSMQSNFAHLMKSQKTIVQIKRMVESVNGHTLLVNLKRNDSGVTLSNANNIFTLPF
jgi:hypothetical protein